MEETLLTYILGSGINYFSMHIFLSSLTNTEIKIPLKKIAIILLCFCVDIIVYFFCGNGTSFITMTTGITIEIIMGYIHEKRIVRCLLISMILAITQALCDGLAAGIFLSVVHKKIEYIYENPVRYMLLNMFYQFLFLVLSISMYIFIKKKRIFNRNNSYWNVMVVMSLGSIYVFYYSLISSSDDVKLEYLPCVICIVLIFAMNIIMFLFYNKLCTDQIVKEERDNLLRYVELQQLEQQNVDAYNKKISKIKHDMSNYLIGVKMLMEKNEYKEAILEIDRVSENIAEINKVVLTSDSVLNYILNAKLWGINNNKIKIISDIFTESKINNISAGDLSIIIGNAIDNAVEYLSSHREAEQEIQLKILYKHGIFSMKVVNEILDNIDIPDTMLIRSTKNSELHGFGIGSIKEITEKYNGNFRIYCIDKKFCLELSMILE